MKPLKLILFLLILAGLASCTGRPTQPMNVTLTPPESMATPTLVELTPNATLEAADDCLTGDGSDDSVADDSVADDSVADDSVADDSVADDGWKIYCNTELGYSFHYPAGANLETNPDQPADGVSVIGPESNGDYWSWIEIRHPQGQAEYKPPADVDLQQWLEDHYMLGATQLAGVQIAGSPAVHLRFNRSPQSYAFDRYYFARAGQLYMILIAHTGDREEWNLYNHFLESFTFGVDP